MTKRIILLGINPYSGNRGVGALAYSTIYLLDLLSQSSDIPFDIQIVGSSKKMENKELTIGANKIKFTQFPLQIGSGVKGKISTLISLIISRKSIKDAEYVMDMGQGDSFSDIYGLDRFNVINVPQRLFRFFGKKLLLLPQTIGPFKDISLKNAAKLTLEKSQTVLVRDRLSYNYVLDNTTQTNVRELIDVAFYMPYVKKKHLNDKLNVGLNISSLMWYNGYEKDQFSFKADYQLAMRAIIDFFLANSEVRLHLVPHVVDIESNVENDYEISREIHDEYHSSQLVTAPLFLDPIDAKNYISGLDFFIGARMHACIAAFSSGVPVYPIAYSRKFNGLFVDTLKYPYLGDLRNQDSDELLDGMKHAFYNRKELSKNLQHSLTTIVTPRYSILMNEFKKFLDIA
ncbi:polysaccharide pyruvyl transferase family protein [Dyadobacter alkalitolerans]|uniref:polysaccharide pyruvyl transferase family protein n=1 Tax=Dyadobacter alkalitolerans TaxID=492736 RepID=UPI0004066B5C|nr:polysaccharide pyruvyl transferase family protein [Dyadobacter alkalitolerans]